MSHNQKIQKMLLLVGVAISCVFLGACGQKGSQATVDSVAESVGNLASEGEESLNESELASIEAMEKLESFQMVGGYGASQNDSISLDELGNFYHFYSLEGDPVTYIVSGYYQKKDGKIVFRENQVGENSDTEEEKIYAEAIVIDEDVLEITFCEPLKTLTYSRIKTLDD